MSAISAANGGDGWSAWHVKRQMNGTYRVRVVSNSQFDAAGAPKVIHESQDIRDGRKAVDKAISESSAYAYRMFT